MKLVIVGPRSVGKSTISKVLANKLNLRYISSDVLMDLYLKKHGGLNGAIRSGILKKYMGKSIRLVENVLKKDNFIFDLAGGAISSRNYAKEARKIVKLLKKYKPFIIGLLPYKQDRKSVLHLFRRECKRKHFKDENKKELLTKTKEDYLKVKKKLNEIADIIMYTKNNKPSEVFGNIIKKFNRAYLN